MQTDCRPRLSEGIDAEDDEEDTYIGAEHVHVFPQAEVVVAVAVLLVLVEHVGVGDLFAPGGFVFC